MNRQRFLNNRKSQATALDQKSPKAGCCFSAVFKKCCWSFGFFACFGLAAISGCSTLQQGQVTEARRQQDALVAQLQEVTTRAKSLDEINTKYQKDIAQAYREIEKSKQESQASATQVAQLNTKIDQLQGELVKQEQKVQTYQTSMPRVSTVMVSSNNGFRDRQLVFVSKDIHFVEDGDFLRYWVPVSAIFVPGTRNLSPEGADTISEVGNKLRLNYPQQPICIEGHAGTLEVNEKYQMSAFELSAQNAFIVANYLISQGILPVNQIRIGTAGANRPVASASDSATSGSTTSNAAGAPITGTSIGQGDQNARIEFVVYPQTL
ncbi:MAG: OmpA family protein [Planctomycetaceae bacterium]|nr:OmpA family protein [Planctomycetaceae bacterium]